MAQNKQNEGLRSTNTSGVKGVISVKKTGKWRAHLVADGRQHCSYHDTFQEACIARWGMECAYHPFRSRPQPIDPMKIIPDGAFVTGVYRFDTKPKRVTFTYVEAAA